MEDSGKSPNHQNQLRPCFSSASMRHVRYCCGHCGFELNLSSCDRNTASIGSTYGKSIKRGIISFSSIDETRFQLVEQFQCLPSFSSNSRLLSLFKRRTRLFCRKCGNHIGVAYESDIEEANSSDSSSIAMTYDVRIRALQPSSVDQSRLPSLTPRSSAF